MVGLRWGLQWVCGFFFFFFLVVMVDVVWCFSVKLFDFVLVMGFVEWVSVGCKVGHGGFVEASGGSGGAGFGGNVRL